MAVPQRGIRWQIKFKSQKGYDCEVNIYLEGFTGTPSQLTGGDIPVYFEEDDTDNLLKAVRIKTGYISFIEETYGHWSAVFPSTNLDRYVEVLYNSQTVFRGFLQAQTFENNWESGPREIQIPCRKSYSVHGLYMSVSRVLCSCRSYMSLYGQMFSSRNFSMNVILGMVLPLESVPEVSGNITCWNGTVSSLPTCHNTEPVLPGVSLSAVGLKYIDCATPSTEMMGI